MTPVELTLITWLVIAYAFGLRRKWMLTLDLEWIDAHNIDVPSSKRQEWWVLVAWECISWPWQILQAGVSAYLNTLRYDAPTLPGESGRSPEEENA